MGQRVTWQYVQDTKLPALRRMAWRAGVPRSEEWCLRWGDVPVLVVDGRVFCEWTTARGCSEYMQAWINALSVVAQYK